MKRRFIGACVTALVTALLMGGGCTEPPLGWDGAGRSQDLPPPAAEASALGSDSESGGPAGLPGLCAPQGVFCHFNDDCCSGMCSKDDECIPTTITDGPVCAPDGVVCHASTDCCDGYCGGGVCGMTPSPVCVPEGIICHSSADCCNACMDGGSEPCTTCPNEYGYCCGIEKGCGTGAPALCVPFGVACETAADCCVGTCTLNSSLQKVCDIPPS